MGLARRPVWEEREAVIRAIRCHRVYLDNGEEGLGRRRLGSGFVGHVRKCELEKVEVLMLAGLRNYKNDHECGALEGLARKGIRRFLYCM